MLFDSSDKKAVVARGVKRRVPEAYDGDVDQTGLPKVNGHRLCITTPLGRRAAAHARHRRRVRTCAYLEIQSIRVKSRHLVPVLKFRFGLFFPLYSLEMLRGWLRLSPPRLYVTTKSRGQSGSVTDGIPLDFEYWHRPARLHPDRAHLHLLRLLTCGSRHTRRCPATRMSIASQVILNSTPTITHAESPNQRSIETQTE